MTNTLVDVLSKLMCVIFSELRMYSLTSTDLCFKNLCISKFSNPHTITMKRQGKTYTFIHDMNNN